jgi:hypothetical protein
MALFAVARRAIHLSSHAQAITGPAWDMAEQRSLPWWR